MAESEQKTPKKFRIRFKKGVPETLNSMGSFEPGEIFIERKNLGTHVLKSNFFDDSLSYSDLKKHTIKEEKDNLINYFNKSVLNNGLTIVNVDGHLQSIGTDTSVTVNINLDTYIEGGIYLFNRETFVLKETIKNGSLINTSLPTNRGFLIVIEGFNQNDIKQIFIDNSGNQHIENKSATHIDRIFIRGKASDSWSAWKEILTFNPTINSRNISDIDDIGSVEIRSGRYQIAKDSWQGSSGAYTFTGEIVYKKPFKEGSFPYVVPVIATSAPIKAGVSIDLADEGERHLKFKFTANRNMSSTADMSFYWIATTMNQQFDKSTD